MMGTKASAMPTDCARNSRNASLKRANVNRPASVTTTQNAPPSRAISARESGERTGLRSAGRSGSRTASAMTAKDRNAGMTANQNTSVKLSAVSNIRTIAASGPMKAPIVSSDCRNPKLAPRRSGVVMSAISASRGAVRMPLPMRSMKRAPENPHDQGGRLGDPLDHADRKRGRAETHDQIERQQRMDHLGGDVH